MTIESTLPRAHQPAAPARLEKAAAEFEALVITELLREIRFAGGGADDPASSTMLDFGQEQMARALSASGGLGLASIAVKGLGEAAGRPASGSEPVVR